MEAYLQQLDDGRPRILGGISWGGKLAAVVARRSPDLLNGLALLCPGIYAHQQPGLLRRCALAAARLPAIGERDVRVPLDAPALFTNDAAHRGYIARDPLVLRRITLRFALADQRLTRAARQAPPSLTMPLLLVLAEGDRIVNNRRMQAFFEASAAVDKAVFEYPGAAHTLEFDRVAPRYMADLLAWIEHVAD